MADHVGTSIPLPDGLYGIRDGKVVAEFDRDEQQSLLHHSFYGTNHEQPLPPGHPPTKTMTAQVKIAQAMDEDLPEASIQNFQRAIDDAQNRALRLAEQRRQETERRESGRAAVEQLERERSADEIIAQARERYSRGAIEVDELESEVDKALHPKPEPEFDEAPLEPEAEDAPETAPEPEAQDVPQGVPEPAPEGVSEDQ